MLITLIVIVVCGAMFYGSYSISSSFYLKSLCRGGDASSTCVAITFDDGVDAVMTPKVLDVLTRHQAKATFFIIGQKAAQHPEIVRQIVERGHTIGNHSNDHKWHFPFQSSSAIFDEITACSAALKRAAGVDVRLFRPPFGVTNPMVGRAVRRSGLTSIGWSVRSLDTMGGRPDQICNRLCHRIRGGSIVLLHDNLSGADLLLEAILVQIEAKGLQTEIIDKLFDIQ